MKRICGIILDIYLYLSFIVASTVIFFNCISNEAVPTHISLLIVFMQLLVLLLIVLLQVNLPKERKEK